MQTHLYLKPLILLWLLAHTPYSLDQNSSLLLMAFLSHQIFITPYAKHPYQCHHKFSPDPYMSHTNPDFSYIFLRVKSWSTLPLSLQKPHYSSTFWNYHHTSVQLTMIHTYTENTNMLNQHHSHPLSKEIQLQYHPIQLPYHNTYYRTFPLPILFSLDNLSQFSHLTYFQDPST